MAIFDKEAAREFTRRIGTGELHQPAPAPAIVRSFSIVGPCLTLGRLVRETKQFYCYEEWLGGDRYGAQKRVMKCRPDRYAPAHIVPCQSCRDHAHTQYPNGYDN